MIKTLAAQIKEYKKVSILTPICMVLEVLMETIIPLLIEPDGRSAGRSVWSESLHRFCAEFTKGDV